MYWIKWKKVPAVEEEKSEPAFPTEFHTKKRRINQTAGFKGKLVSDPVIRTPGLLKNHTKGVNPNKSIINKTNFLFI